MLNQMKLEFEDFLMNHKCSQHYTEVIAVLPTAIEIFLDVFDGRRDIFYLGTKGNAVIITRMYLPQDLCGYEIGTGLMDIANSVAKSYGYVTQVDQITSQRFYDYLINKREATVINPNYTVQLP